MLDVKWDDIEKEENPDSKDTNSTPADPATETVAKDDAKQEGVPDEKYLELTDKLHGLSILESGDKITSSDDIVSLIKNGSVSFIKGIISSLPPDVSGVIKYFHQNPQGSLKDYIESTHQEEVSIDTPENQEKVVRKEYSKVMKSKAAIDSAIAKLKDDGMLEDEAKGILVAEKADKDAKKDSISTKFDSSIEDQRNEIKTFLNSVYNTVIADKKYEGTESDARDNISFLFNPIYKSKDGYITGLDKVLLEAEQSKDYIRLIEIAKFIKSNSTAQSPKKEQKKVEIKDDDKSKTPLSVKLSEIL